MDEKTRPPLIRQAFDGLCNRKNGGADRARRRWRTGRSWTFYRNRKGRRLRRGEIPAICL